MRRMAYEMGQGQWPQLPYSAWVWVVHPPCMRLVLNSDMQLSQPTGYGEDT